MSKEFLSKHKQKEEVSGMWNKGQATWEECSIVVRICRDVTRNAKVLGVKSGEGGQGQQERLLQVHQQQKDD